MAKGTPKGAKRPVKKAAPKKPATARSTSAASATSSRPRPAAQRSRQEKEKRALRNRLIAGAVLLVVIGAVVFSAVSSGDGAASALGPLDEGAGNCTLDSKADRAGPETHIPKPTYKVDPPAGGSHEPSAAKPGFYRAANVPPDGQLVHALEHGFVVLWHRPDLPAEKIDQIEALSDRLGRELIVAPRESLTGEVAVTAWKKRLLCGELVPEKVAEFSRLYRDKGPEKGFL